MEISKAEKHPVHLSVFLSFEMNLRLEEFCHKEDRSKANAIRHAIRLLLDEEGY